MTVLLITLVYSRELIVYKYCNYKQTKINEMLPIIGRLQYIQDIDITMNNYTKVKIPKDAYI